MGIWRQETGFLLQEEEEEAKRITDSNEFGLETSAFPHVGLATSMYRYAYTRQFVNTHLSPWFIS